MSLQQTDQESAAVATHPRVSLADIEAAILRRHNFTVAEAVDAIAERAAVNWQSAADAPESLLSICILVMRNGFTVVGKAAPASPENFNSALGMKFAYEDAVRQLWPLMGFALRDKLASGSPLGYGERTATGPGSFG